MTSTWNDRYAARIRTVTSSAIRDLLNVTAQPDVISFAGGLPAPELFPVEVTLDATARVLEQVGPAALQYGPTEGVMRLRTWVAEQASLEGEAVTADQVLITTGSQQALDLLAKAFVDDGARVVVEDPSYVGALQALALMRPRFVTVASDEDGPVPDALAERLGGDPALAYLMPSFQNPTGLTMPEARRAELAQVIAAHGTPVVEDDPYGEIWFDAPAAPSLRSRVPERVIGLGTFSKTLAPGFRLGWVIAPAEVIGTLAQAKQAADLHTSTFNQYVALAMVESGMLSGHLKVLRRVYEERRDAMLDAMQDAFPSSARWLRPSGGMFVWVRLPAGMDSAEVLADAMRRERVAFVPGAAFHACGGGGNTFRLNFTNAEPDVIRDGIARLGAVLRRHLPD